MPVVDIEISEVALYMQFSALAAFHHDIHHVDVVSHGVEVQGRYLRRYRHIDIVGIDLRQFVDNRRILHPLGASQHHQHHDYTYYIIYMLHFSPTVK